VCHSIGTSFFLVESGEEGTTGVGIGFMTAEHAADIQAEYCFAEGGNVNRYARDR